MAPKQKLELTWLGKDVRPKLEPRILLEDPEKSYHARERRSDKDIFDNLLVFGDNLLALRALESEFSGKVKCVFIDPPYNTGAAFTHYDDGVEHSLWLSLMSTRLEILRRLLSANGSLWITLDDNEAHYCKVLCDEVFGRGNFIANVIWEKADSPRMDAEFFSTRHDHLLVYARDRTALRIAKGVGVAEGPAPHYDKRDGTGRPYYTKPLRAMGGDDARSDRPTLYFKLEAPDGSSVLPVRKDGSDGRWRWSKQRTLDDAHLIEWVRGKAGWSPYYRIYGDVESKRPPETIWPHWEVGSNRTSKAEIKALFGGSKAFETPKPEALLARVINLATQPGDVVLDSFAGSGTGAVAHKMRRRWIMVEVGDHCHSHIIPRLRKVVDGQDQGGVTEPVGWEGGGGFRYYRMASSLIQRDRFDQPIINKQYRPEMLAEALCKLEGFTYAPSDAVYWQHGHSTERDFIYVTTQTFTAQQLQALSDEVGKDRSLLVLCAAHRAKDTSGWPNLTIKKIPPAILDKCEWGKDDYSLAIRYLPQAADSPPVQVPAGKRPVRSRLPRVTPLFDEPSSDSKRTEST